MRRREILREGKWWDDSPTITLNHGTSSALVPAIRKHGLQPPSAQMEGYVRSILRDYLPEEQWPPGLLNAALQAALGSAIHKRRSTPDTGPVLYFSLIPTLPRVMPQPLARPAMSLPVTC